MFDCKLPLLFILSLIITFISHGQSFIKDAVIQGNIHTDIKLYFKDSISEITEKELKLRSNSFGNIRLNYKKFSAGLRYEAYLPPLLGYDIRYEGHGIANLFGTYNASTFSVTAGSYYEQFGSGLILRIYENKDLGIDNSLTGFRVAYKPLRGLSLKGIAGRQRDCWSFGNGWVRGADAELNLPEIFGISGETAIITGIGAVSRYQKDNDPVYKFPENVAAFSGRISIFRRMFQFSGEYGFKINDPSAVNNLIYKNGQALVLTSSYSVEGIGILITGKWIDNMDFRSERGATGQTLTLGFMPATFSQHTYALQGMYPYASQPSGEATLHSELTWTIRPESLLGGNFGTNVSLSFSMANAIRKETVNPSIPVGTTGTKGYKSAFLSVDDQKYFRDFSVEISRKFSNYFKSVAGFTRLFYNQSVMEGHPSSENVKASVAYADLSFRLSRSGNIRTELQYLITRQDKGSWAMALLEYTIVPGWNFTFSDEFNFGNDVSHKGTHYPLLNIVFSRKAQSFGLSIGRQREGLICVGGICRHVPSSSGSGLTYSLTF
jgi:hypothetical protein